MWAKFEWKGKEWYHVVGLILNVIWAPMKPQYTITLHHIILHYVSLLLTYLPTTKHYTTHHTLYYILHYTTLSFSHLPNHFFISQRYYCYQYQLTSISPTTISISIYMYIYLYLNLYLSESTCTHLRLYLYICIYICICIFIWSRRYLVFVDYVLYVLCIVWLRFMYRNQCSHRS